MRLWQGGIGALGHILLDVKVEAAHIVTEGGGTGVPIGFDGGIFALPEGNGIGKFGALGGLRRRLRVVGRGHISTSILDAFPFTEDDGIGDFTGGRDRKQWAFNFRHGESRSFQALVEKID